MLQTTQIKQGVSFIAANKVYTNTNKTTIVWIETELFFLPGVDASHVYVRALALGCFYSHMSTRTFRRALTASLHGQLRGNKENPFSGVTKSGRVWRKVPEGGAWSVVPRLWSCLTVCADSPSHVPRLWSCLTVLTALVMYPDCGPVWLCVLTALDNIRVSCTQTVVLSGTGRLQCVLALVMYPDCGPVWHGQSSVCTSQCHVPSLWSCLARADFSVCQPLSCSRLWSWLARSLQCAPALVMYPDCGPV